MILHFGTYYYIRGSKRVKAASPCSKSSLMTEVKIWNIVKYIASLLMPYQKLCNFIG